MNKIVTEGRLDFFDLLKLFAMYLVIVGHCIQYLYDSYQTNPLWLAIYTFHVPLFLIISGFFFHSSNFLNFSYTRAYLKTRFITLIQPCIVVSFILFVILLALNFIFDKRILTIWGVKIFVMDQWFLKSLLLDTIIVVLICSCKRIWIRVMLSLVVVMVLLFYRKLDLWYICETLPFFVFGIGLKKMFFFKIASPWFLLLNIIIFTLLCSGYKISYSSQFTPLNLFSIYIYMYRIVFAISISLIFISLFANLFSLSRGLLLKKIIHFASLGKLTLYIYVIQYLVLERLLCYLHLPIIISPAFNTFVVVPAIAAGIMAMCIIVYKYTLKYPLLSKIVWGIPKTYNKK